MKWVFEHPNLQMFGLKFSHSWSETQLQVGENLNMKYDNLVGKGLKIFLPFQRGDQLSVPTLNW